MGKLTWSVLKKQMVHNEVTGVSLELEQLIGNSGFKIPHGRKVVSDLDFYKVHVLIRGLRFTLVDDFADVIECPKTIELRKTIEFPKTIQIAKTIPLAKTIKTRKTIEVPKVIDVMDVEVLLLEKIYKEVLSKVTATGIKKKGNMLVFKVFTQGGYRFGSLAEVLQNGSQGVVGLSLVSRDNRELACWYFDNDSLTSRYLRSYDFADDFVANEVHYLQRSSGNI